ncbi:MAG: minor capsid protein, partial [Christensenellales bacterium]
QRELEISTQSYVSTLKNGYYRHLYDVQRGAGLGFQVADFSPQRLREALAQEWSGRHYSARIWDNAQALAGRLRADLMAAALSGRSEREIARQIADDYQVGAYQSRRLVRTESAYLAGRADQLAYEELGIDRYRYLATLDMRTSSLCQGLDGRQFACAEAKVGVNYPPMHPNCRSTTVAVIDDEALERMERRAKNPVTGETELVPAHMSYDKWLQGLEEKYGVDSLAVSRKKVLNARQDRAQLKEYRRVLGNRVPRSLDAFQTLKYTGGRQWRLRKLDYSRRMDLQNHPEKALPLADQATAAEKKFTGYFYNPDNPNGYAKGKGFERALGFDEEHWQELREQLIENASLYPAKWKMEDSYGARWQQDQIILGINGRVANVRVGWNVNETSLYLTTAHLEEI